MGRLTDAERAFHENLLDAMRRLGRVTDHYTLVIAVREGHPPRLMRESREVLPMPIAEERAVLLE